MNQISDVQVYGIGAVAVAAFTLLGALLRSMISVLQKNAESNAVLAKNIEGLQKSIEQNTEVTRSTKDLFSTAFVQMVRENNKQT
jgi:hypothetical protein